MISLRAARSKTTMSTIIAVTAVVISVVTGKPATAQGEAFVEFLAPSEGVVLAGIVEIRGTVDTPLFLSANLSFAYTGGSGAQWFLIAEIPQPTTDAVLARWDTNIISDGEYSLRLRLNGTDGTVRDAVIRVQVRNYSSGPTPTASVVPTGPAALVVETPVIAAATETATRPALQTPTPFPRNPAALTGTDVLGALARGGIAIIAAFLLWGAITLRRRM